MALPHQRPPRPWPLLTCLCGRLRCVLLVVDLQASPHIACVLWIIRTKWFRSMVSSPRVSASLITSSICDVQRFNAGGGHPGAARVREHNITGNKHPQCSTPHPAGGELWLRRRSSVTLKDPHLVPGQRLPQREHHVAQLLRVHGSGAVLVEHQEGVLEMRGRKSARE